MLVQQMTDGADLDVVLLVRERATAGTTCVWSCRTAPAR
jgi:hypothetical protein